MLKQTTLTVAIVLSLFTIMTMPVDLRASNDWNDACYKAGFKDGLDNPFSIPTWDHCGDEEGGDDAYYDGFIDGCMSVEGNITDACESATDSSE